MSAGTVPISDCLRSRRLWSLWDMILFFSYVLAPIEMLEQQSRAPDFALLETPPPRPALHGAPLKTLIGETLAANYVSDRAKNLMGQILDYLETVANQMELDAVLDRIQRFRLKLTFPITTDDYRTEARITHEAVQDQFQRRLCWYIKIEHKQLMDFQARNWSKTLRSFDSVAPEIKSAVQCLATGNSTATVFHLMRIAEIGLRALARERRIKLAKNRPLEWADWSEMLSGLDNKVKAIGNKPRGAARQRALDFYNGVLGEFGAFRDAYRNNVMHARVTYDEPQAVSTMNHVREFMERLSAKISEDQTKQISWGRM